MPETEDKSNLEFMQKHTLTEQDMRRLIKEKFERAKQYALANKNREAEEFA